MASNDTTDQQKQASSSLPLASSSSSSSEGQEIMMVSRPHSFAIPLNQVDRTMIGLVGGKAANLGDMIQAGSKTTNTIVNDKGMTKASFCTTSSSVSGGSASNANANDDDDEKETTTSLGGSDTNKIPVPPGFAVTSLAFDRFMEVAHRTEQSSNAAGGGGGGVGGGFFGLFQNSKTVKFTDLLSKIDEVASQMQKEQDEDNSDSNDVLSVIRDGGANIRSFLQNVALPEDVTKDIKSAWDQFLLNCPSGNGPPSVAVRSSATAEDLPLASFAGQHDTYLNVTGGIDEVLSYIKQCWISLFTDRAIVYRLKNKFDYRLVKLCVVVQYQICHPYASGIMFTANVLSGNRNETVIEAGYGLGEALVSGLINGDSYKYDRPSGTLVDVTIGDKKVEIVSAGGDGNPSATTTKTIPVDEQRQKKQVLTSEQIKNLVQMGEMIQSHYGGKPQDIEWCIEQGSTSDQLFIVQSRPITTLFPYPITYTTRDIDSLVTQDKSYDEELHVYVSFGHIQVMTSPFTPCGRSLFHNIFGESISGRFEQSSIKESRLARNAGECYLYMEMTRLLQIPFLRNVYVDKFAHMSAGIAASVDTVVSREKFQHKTHSFWSNAIFIGKVLYAFLGIIWLRVAWRLWFVPNPRAMSRAATAFMERRVKEVKKLVRAPPTERERFLEALTFMETQAVKDVQWLAPYAMAGLLAPGLLRKVLGVQSKQDDSIGSKNSNDDVPEKDEAATTSSPSTPTIDEDIDALRRGLYGNVTTEMDLKIGDLADVARSEPASEAWLLRQDKTSHASTQWEEELKDVGEEKTEQFRHALKAFLDEYGCRCAGEIDFGRPRWIDDPSSVLQVVRGNLSSSSSESLHHREHHKKLVQQNEEAAHRIISSVPWYKKFIVQRLVTVTQTLGALREHHKFLLIQYMFELRLAVIDVATMFYQQNIIASKDDIWMLTLDEIKDALDEANENTRARLKSIIAERRERWQHESKLKPPAVLTSEGECVTTQPKIAGGNIPEGALTGLPVSSGIVEGIAKVVLNPTTAVLRKGEILVCPCTDPGWTPLFINAVAVVMEVGGYLTHGSVVSREYGIPAVSCIETATTSIRSGMKLRVNGTLGFVEILPDEKQEEVGGKDNGIQ